MTTGVYGIFDTSTGECLYIGQSVNIETRWYHHRRDLKLNKHLRPEIQSIFDSRGITAFEFRILEECDGESLFAKEVEWFEKLKPKYWGVKPAPTWKWSNLGTEAMEKALAKRSAKALEDFKRLDAEWGEKVVELYNQGETSATIPNFVPFSFGTVLRILSLHGVEYRSRRDTVGFEYSRGKTDDELRNELKALRAEGKSWPQIAKLWGCADTTMKDLTKRLGLYEAPPKFAFAELSDEEVKSKILELEAKGLDATAIAKELGVGRTTIFRRMHKFFPERFATSAKH